MGNTQAKRSVGDDHEADGLVSGSPPMSPGSPLTYSPQVAMEPLARDDGAGPRAADFVGAAGWPAQPKLVPVVIVWSHGGSHVEVEGSFDNWTTRQPLQYTGKDWTIIKLLPPGVYQYKFIVDGEWRHDPNQPAMYDEMANVNNVIEVQEYAPENLDNVSGFDPPPSPPSSYCNPPPAAEDYAKEPPLMPPHLQLTLLNVPAAEAGASLPRPQHVILGHLYLQRGQSTNALVVGTTHRYKGKYITSVLYKPRPGRRRDEAAAHAHFPTH
ncbi:hypothetical protein Rsub_06465 [Raphidocelis subcapitata]|uniref:Association with the SNF1 complex (ASC) domain-containing protein n=1 Tax=Raphidocelis subcapitata TaxID=307507 RepID=A0A2V0PAS0_9CHLO|nr:hypothetical protein Rsub_06465 [Raphidocelis subcapitata]|eukprot:GBF94195.1 hypothetical protein Rsub_06465 [Raphidocelis subcapitata]